MKRELDDLKEIINRELFQQHRIIQSHKHTQPRKTTKLTEINKVD